MSMAMADEDLTIVYPYFEEPGPLRRLPGRHLRRPDGDRRAAGRPDLRLEPRPRRDRQRPARSGLRLDLLDEHDWTSSPAFPWLVEVGEEEFVIPEGQVRVPLSFTLVATPGPDLEPGSRPGDSAVGSSGFRDGPAGAGHLAGLVEQAALGACERELLVRAHPALLELLLAGSRLHDVMTAIVEYGHTPFCPKPDGIHGGGGVASVTWTPPPPPTPLRGRPHREAAPPLERGPRRVSPAPGLGFTESLYEQERFEEVLHVAADIRAAVDGNERGRGRRRRRPRLAGHRRQGRPRLRHPQGGGRGGRRQRRGRDPARPAGRLRHLALPTGWADVGYSAPEVVVKEVLEETGIEVEVVRLIAVLDGLRVGMSRIPLYSLVFQCRPVGGELKAHPLECADVGWFPLDALPFPLAGAERWGDHVFAALRGEPIEVLYDSVRSPVWRGDPTRSDPATSNSRRRPGPGRHPGYTRRP